MSETVVGSIRRTVRRPETGEVLFDETTFNDEGLLFDLVVPVRIGGVLYELVFSFDPPLYQIPAEPAPDEGQTDE